MAIQSVGKSQNFASENIQRTPQKVPEVEQKSEKSQVTTMSTDRVDSEINSLKSKGLSLAKSINAYNDENTRLHLQKQLKQIQNELRQKDNDIYRRQNAQISMGVNIEA